MTSSRLKSKRARKGWTPGGPEPAGDRGDPTLRPEQGETLDRLCGNWRIFQLERGHRFSQDDILTAWLAVRCAEGSRLEVRRILDLGTGIGTVGMILAWKYTGATLLGVEVQTVSASLARRSIRYNGIEDRAEIRLGDLRDPDVVTEGPVFDLVTGSPPYIPEGRGVVSRKAQCGPSRFEMHGGVEDYCRAAAGVLADHGLFTVVHDSRQRDRVEAAGTAAGLGIVKEVAVIPREGKDPLFSLFAMRKESTDPGHGERREMVIRDRRGKWTPEYREVRLTIGFPPGY